MIRIEVGGDRTGGERHELERPAREEPVDHAGRNAGGSGEAGFRPGETVGSGFEDALAGVRHPLRRRAGKPHADHGLFRLERALRAEHHAQDHAARSERVVGHPIDEFEQRTRERRRVVNALDLADFCRRHVVGHVVPDRADHEPRAERHGDDRPRRELAVGGVGVGLFDRVGEKDGDQMAH